MLSLSNPQARFLRLRAQRLYPHRTDLVPGAAQTVRAVCGVQAQDPLSAELAVRVRSAGLAASDIETAMLRERFWRGDRSRSRSVTAGGGLGLAIAHRLVQAHGGQLDVRTEVGLGTTFTIQLLQTGSLCKLDYTRPTASRIRFDLPAFLPAIVYGLDTPAIRGTQWA